MFFFFCACCIGCPRQNINHSSERLKVIYIRVFMFYAIINHQWKNVKTLVEHTVQALSPVQMDWESAFFVQANL